MRVGRALAGDDDPGMEPIGVLLLDDHRVFLETVALRLRAQHGLRVVAAACDPSDILRPDVAREGHVAVLDLHLTHGSGIDVARSLRTLNPQLSLVALTATDSEEQATAAVAAGFTGWVRKDTTVEALVETIHAVHQGETRVPGHLLVAALRHLMANRARTQPAARRLDELSLRERQVLDLMAQGCSRQTIGRRLYISPNTVRTHQQHILSKLGVHSALGAVALVIEATGSAESGRPAGPPGAVVDLTGPSGSRGKPEPVAANQGGIP